MVEIPLSDSEVLGQAERIASSEKDGPLLAIFAVTYQHHRKLDIFIQSVLEQTWVDKCRLSILHDGPVDQDTLDRVKRYHPEMPGGITLISSTHRENVWGHNLRDLALKAHLLPECEFINFQNADNYLTPKFAEFMLERAAGGYDFVYCDILHSYPNVNFDGAMGYNVLRSRPQMNFMDIANFIVRGSLAREIGFRWRSFAADGEFINQLMAEKGATMKLSKVNSCLLVHN